MTTQSIRLPIMLVTMLILLTAIPVAGAAEGAQDGAVVDAHQLAYEINRARWDPAAFEARAGDVTFPLTVVPTPPLAMSPSLEASATWKANEMIAAGYFGHQSEATGLWPNELARLHGYDLPDSFADDANGIESLYAGSSDPIRVLSALARSSSHRTHVFGQGDRFALHSEMGVGRGTDGNFWAIHTGYSNTGARFFTGAVFHDADGDGFLGRDEGLSGVVVSVSGLSTVTGESGVYSLPIAPGTAVIEFQDADGALLGAAEVVVDDYNVWVDMPVGGQPVVRAFSMCGTTHPTILGTSGDDVLHATARRDVIHGLGGDDVIIGLGADDIVCPLVEPPVAPDSEPIQRLAGVDRFDTAAAISRSTHPSTSAVVYLATGENFPDALAVGPVAAEAGAPILLTRRTSLPGPTADELARLAPSLIVIVGGTSAVDKAVEDQLAAVVPAARVLRLAGASRFETAVEVSRHGYAPGVAVAYVVNGLGFPDALVGTPAAFSEHGPILLVAPDEIPTAVAEELERLRPRRIVIVGSAASVSNRVEKSLRGYTGTVIRIEGSDRYATAAAMSQFAFAGQSPTVYLAVGSDYPDGLTGGAAVFAAPGPILLVGHDTVPQVVFDEIRRLNAERVVILGGTAAISSRVEAAVARAMSVRPQRVRG